METDLQRRLRSLAVKASMLVDRYNTVKEQLGQAQARIADLEAELERTERSHRQLLGQVEYLRMAAAAAGAPDEGLRPLRDELSEIIREIDKCIEQLKY